MKTGGSLVSKIKERIVLIGGGNGVRFTGQALTDTRPNVTTIHTVFDCGGHAGKLRKELGGISFGDIRRGLAALADKSLKQTQRRVLDFRFPDGSSFGNYLLTGLSQCCHDPIEAIQIASEMFGVKGKIYPISLDDTELCAFMSDNSILKGEDIIDTRSIEDPREICSIYLDPAANIYMKSYEEIVRADKVIFCPGDLLTSVAPNTLVSGFRDAMAETKAMIVEVMNTMTKKAETPGYTASRFARVLLGYIGQNKFHAVICSNTSIAPEILARYRQEMSEPVAIDTEKLYMYTDRIISEDLAEITEGKVRHNSRKLASIIANL